MNKVYKTLTIWVLIMSAEVFHGIIRGIFLVPYFGQFTSGQIGVFTGMIIIFTITYFTIKWFGFLEKKELLIIGIVWLILTLIFEFYLGYFVMGYQMYQILAYFNPMDGRLLSFGMIFLLFSPFLATKLRNSI